MAGEELPVGTDSPERGADRVRADDGLRAMASRCLAGAAGAIGAVALVGWFFHIPVLTEVIPGLVKTKFNTAAAIFGLSATWFLPRRAMVTVTALVGLLAALTVLEYVGRVDVGIDQLLVRDDPVANPGRMALTTAVFLLLLAWSIGTLARGRRRFVQPAAVIVLTATGLTLLGYLYGVPYLSYLGRISTLALPTAVALACLSLAVLVGVDSDGGLWWMLRERDAGSRMLRALLPWTLVALPVLALLQQLGQRAGWYDVNFGLALTVGMAVLVLTIVAWKAAGALAKVDRRRTVALSDLENLSSELERRVEARTAELQQERADLRTAEAAARKAEAEAVKANAAKDEFFSRTSHELRTPLNAVLGFAQLLELGDLSDDQHEAVAHILRGGRHLVGLVDTVLDISQIDRDQLAVSLEVVPIAALLGEVVALMTPRATRDGVHLDFDPDRLPDHRVIADHRRLRQVLLNLLSNAIGYNHPGGHVTISCESSDGALRIAVTDTGRGIRSADLPRLFMPFDRLGAEAAGIDGTGVALALSRRLMTVMGGHLTATSVEGAGSTFTASVPLATPADLHAAAAAGALVAPRTSPESTGPRRTLLYIEDNSSNIHLMEQLVIHRPPWHLVVAGHGALGLELAISTHPDLILLDLHLPDMDGIDLLRQLRTDPATSEVKIIVLSADANPHQVDRLLAAGAHRYLTKPLHVPDMLELLAS